MENKHQSATTSLWSQSSLKSHSFLIIQNGTVYFFDTDHRREAWKKLFRRNITQFLLYRRLYRAMKRLQEDKGSRLRVLFINTTAEIAIDFKKLFEREIELFVATDSQISSDIIQQRIKEWGVWADTIFFEKNSLPLTDKSFDFIFVDASSLAHQNFPSLILELKRIVIPSLSRNIFCLFTNKESSLPAQSVLRGVADGARLTRPSFSYLFSIGQGLTFETATYKWNLIYFFVAYLFGRRRGNLLAGFGLRNQIDRNS